MVDTPATKMPDGHQVAGQTGTPAERALAEAEARRVSILKDRAAQSTEVNGRGGLEPTRYGDWEIKGLTSDF